MGEMSGRLWFRRGAMTLAQLSIVLASIDVAACRQREQPAVPATTRLDAASPAHAPAPIRVRDLFARRDTLLHQHVVVDIFDSLADASESSRIGPGELVVSNYDYPDPVRLVGPNRGALPNVADRTPPHSAVRVSGTLEEGDGDASPRGLEIRVERIEPIALPTPDVIGACSAITAGDAGSWDGRCVQCDGMWHQRMEASSLDGTWMDVARYATIVNSPDAAREPGGMSYPVRVTGIVDAARGRYGHMGRYRAMIVATRVEYTGQPLSALEYARERLLAGGGLGAALARQAGDAGASGTGSVHPTRSP